MVQDPQERLERYEKEIHELQTQIKFLEDETALLRRRLTNAPRQVKILEERLLQSRADLSRALAQNEKLVSALKSERDKIEALKEEVEKLTQPPAQQRGLVLEELDLGLELVDFVLVPLQPLLRVLDHAHLPCRRVYARLYRLLRNVGPRS